MVTRRWATIMMASVLVGLAGCGDSDDDGPPLSASAYRDRANALCREATEANEAAFKGIDQDDASAVAKATAEIGRRTEKSLDELDDLEGPDAAEASMDRFLDITERYTEAAQRQSDALAKGDRAAAQRAADELDGLTDDAQQSARDAGLDACAS